MRSLRRLFEIVEIIRSRRTTTAAWLAETLGVSERTIYRNMQDLQAAGIPIVGTPGEGYRLLEGFNLKPMAFTDEELEALASGVQLVQQGGDGTLAPAAGTAAAKIRAVLPRARQLSLASPALSAPGMLSDEATRERLQALRAALRARRRLTIAYRDDDGVDTRRRVRPLHLAFWGRVWTLVAWCELRGDFRTFRLDRVLELAPDEAFVPEAGRTLEDYLERLRRLNP